jgi:hypothetical protein
MEKTTGKARIDVLEKLHDPRKHRENDPVSTPPFPTSIENRKQRKCSMLDGQAHSADLRIGA